MNFLLYHSSTAPTGRELATTIGIDGGTIPPESKVDTLIRWGNGALLRFKPTRVINKRSALTLAANKLISLVVLKGEQLSVPEIITLEQIRDGYHPTFPILGRKRHHSQGTDIVLCLQNIDVQRAISRGESDYFIQYVPTQREYRVHIFRNEVIRVSQKFQRDGERPVPFIRNTEHGHVFLNPRIPLSDASLEACKLAVNSLGLDFGAVDILIGDNNNTYILEVNTGPGLIEIGVELYARKFKQLLGLPNVPTQMANLEQTNFEGIAPVAGIE